ncbi:MAG: translation initiation factor IF-3 [Fibrobacter sp.]|nr:MULTISPECIES: translation initiation factor IF-3 [unclassified Fibrobacter]MDD5942418.1 translation initiation factor IF-3 [Fibrobacter sp.]MDY6262815.1 translation initiation factor IF-3 [Fibrobacter sp.]SHK27086.1 bacterial translation initiation factor 3 (bIF-3) [Fibrobacter sp. UWH4]SHK52702.1 bacterial translation initiation factor 3 (bIF-3) [Fibrobacter sp. UWOV1]
MALQNPRDRRMPNRQSDGTRINEDIRISPIRLVKDDGEAVIMDTKQALQMAKDAGLDLVEVSPNAKPPVCRIINYGKYKFEQIKKAKAAKAKQHVVKLKEIKMHPKTAENDYQYRIKQAAEFLQDGMKVKLIMQFRGREMAHMDYGKRLMERAKEDLLQYGDLEMDSRVEGNTMLSIYGPKRGAGTAKKQPQAPKPVTEPMAAGEAST